MDTFADRFDIASSFLSLPSGSEIYLFCGLVITRKEARIYILVSKKETLKKLEGIAGKLLKVKSVCSHAKNYELVWNKVKDLDTQSEDYEGVLCSAHATCCCNFYNTKKLETNSKQEINEIYE